MSIRYETAESVCMGHPDKLCDLIADSILDACLQADKAARVACEVMATKGKIIVAGEISCRGNIHIRSIVQQVLQKVGYEPWKFQVKVYVHQQSADIAAGVDQALEARNGDAGLFGYQGAGDQGTVYGYATSETPEMLPLPLVLAHRIVKRLDQCRKAKLLPGVLPDGKAQVTIAFEDGKLPRVQALVLSAQHKDSLSQTELKAMLLQTVIGPCLKDVVVDEQSDILINPSGRFVEGGPEADTGLTGRKIMVDSYGGLAAHGGGAFSGKDPSKVDRSGAYMARYIAKNLVRSGVVDRCEVALSYAIGKADPVAVAVQAFGTSEYGDEQLTDLVKSFFLLRPAAIVEQLSLRDVAYAPTATYGHFHSQDFPWEKLDVRVNLRKAATRNAN